MIVVTIDDIKALRYCTRGAREFFAAHGLDWGSFIQHGIDSEILLSLNDAMADAAVAQARCRLGESE